MKVKTSQAVMNRFGWMLLACGLAVIVGCQPKETKLSPTAGGPPTTEEPAEVAPKDPVDDVRKLLENTKPLEGVHEIDRPTEKWDAVEPTKPVAKKGLGEIIDDGIEDLDATLVKVTLQCLDRDTVLQMNPTIRIQDAKHFMIEYSIPETEADINILASDGQERAYFEDQKVRELPPFGKNQVREKLNKQEITEFVKRMPVEGFRYYSHGDRPWSAFIAGLNDPKNGFKVTLEEKNFKPVGEERPFYRFVAKSSGKDATDIEIIVDTKRNVPVTFRANMTYPDGKQRKLFWKAEWQFGGKFEAKDFRIPTQ